MNIWHPKPPLATMQYRDQSEVGGCDSKQVKSNTSLSLKEKNEIQIKWILRELCGCKHGNKQGVKDPEVSWRYALLSHARWRVLEKTSKDAVPYQTHCARHVVELSCRTV